MMTLAELIAALEAADGPNRELDIGIARFVDVQIEGRLMRLGANDRHYRSSDGWPYLVPLFTSSLDAALTLVPEGWAYGIAVLVGKRPRGWVCERTVRDEPIAAWGSSSAIALCIAALKAREAGA